MLNKALNNKYHECALGQVRALTLADFGDLVAKFPTEALSFLDTSKDVKDASHLIQGSVNFIAHVIAKAADEPDSWEIVKATPLGDQLEAFNLVWNLTRIDPEMLGKLWFEALRQGVRVMQSAVAASKNASWSPSEFSSIVASASQKSET